MKPSQLYDLIHKIDNHRSNEDFRDVFPAVSKQLSRLTGLLITSQP